MVPFSMRDVVCARLVPTLRVGKFFQTATFSGVDMNSGGFSRLSCFAAGFSRWSAFAVNDLSRLQPDFSSRLETVFRLNTG